MYENEIIEMEDFMFNHYIHHFDEYDFENEYKLNYNDEYGCLEASAECIEEFIWD
jgi:hypothetical protein